MTKTQPKPEQTETPAPTSLIEEVAAAHEAALAEDAERQAAEPVELVAGAASLLMDALAAWRPGLGAPTGVTINPLGALDQYRVAVATTDAHGTPVGVVLVVDRKELPAVAE